MNNKATLERARLVVEAVDLGYRFSTGLGAGNKEDTKTIADALREMASAEMRALSAEIQDAQTIEAFRQLPGEVASDVREAAVSGSVHREADAIVKYGGLGVSARMLNLLSEGKIPLP